MADARLPNKPSFAENFCYLAKQGKLGPKIAFYLGLVKVKSGGGRKNLVRKLHHLVNFSQKRCTSSAGMSEAEVVSEIKTTNIGIVDDLVGPAMGQYFACVNNVGTVDEA